MQAENQLDNNQEVNKVNINWYPGHMHKARGELKKVADKIDLVIELLDARIPESSKNNFLPNVIKDLPHIYVLTKADLADEQATQIWQQHLKNAENQLGVYAINNKNLKTLKPLQKAIEDFAKTKSVKRITAIVVGVPNLGKSTLINNLAGRKVAQTANQPGVTRGQKFIKINDYFNILDTPGILWGKIADRLSGELMAINSVIKESRFSNIEICLTAIEVLQQNMPEKLTNLKLDITKTPSQILEDYARKTSCMKKGGIVDIERASLMFLNAFRSGKYGGITWELPQQTSE